MPETVLVHSFLSQSALKFPEKQALLQAKEQMSYGELAGRADQISQWLLRHDVQVGDRVAILTDQACDYVTSYFGIIAVGGIVIGLNTQTSEHVLEAVLSDSECSIVLSNKKFKKYASVITEQPSVRYFELDIRMLWDKDGTFEKIELPELSASPLG